MEFKIYRKFMIYGINAETFVDIQATQYAFVRFHGFFNQIYF